MSVLQEPVSDIDHQRGPENAPVVLVEYGDYQCPYCGEAYAVVQRIREEMGASVRVAYRHFPLLELHPQAFPAALVAEYAAQHGEFWAAHDALFRQQHALGPDLYKQLLHQLKLPLQGLEQALEQDSLGPRIRRDIDSGQRSGVHGTPAFFLNGQLMEIQTSYQELYDAVAYLLHHRA